MSMTDAPGRSERASDSSVLQVGVQENIDDSVTPEMRSDDNMADSETPEMQSFENLHADDHREIQPSESIDESETGESESDGNLDIQSENITQTEGSEMISPVTVDKSGQPKPHPQGNVEEPKCAGDQSPEKTKQSWRHELVLDIGEHMSVPEFTQGELRGDLWWRYLAAGGVAGAVARTSVAPLERLKVVMQASRGDQRLSPIKTLRSLLREGGVRSLWRGNAANLIKIAPESTLAVAAYETGRKQVTSGELSASLRFLLGAGSEVFSQSIVYPMGVIKTRLEISMSGQYEGVLHCGRTIVAREGVRALYRGAAVHLLLPVPYAGVDTLVFESLRRWWTRHQPRCQQQPDMRLVLAFAAVSATCGQFTTYPFTLIRTMMQARVYVDVHGKKMTFVDIGQDIFRKHGLRGLYRGMVPNFLKLLPAVVISSVTYKHTALSLGIS